MTQSIDYNEAGEIFRKSMEDALANLDKVTEEAKLAHEKAIDEQIAAKEEFKRIQNDAHQISEAYIEKHRKEFEVRLREEILFKITKNMIIDGQPTQKIYRWLEVSQKMMADAWFELGFEALGNHVANVSYDQKGRAGDVIFLSR